MEIPAQSKFDLNERNGRLPVLCKKAALKNFEIREVFKISFSKKNTSEECF